MGVLLWVVHIVWFVVYSVQCVEGCLEVLKSTTNNIVTQGILHTHLQGQLSDVEIYLP